MSDTIPVMYDGWFFEYHKSDGKFCVPKNGPLDRALIKKIDRNIIRGNPRRRKKYRVRRNFKKYSRLHHNAKRRRSRRGKRR